MSLVGPISVPKGEVGKGRLKPKVSPGLKIKKKYLRKKAQGM